MKKYLFKCLLLLALLTLTSCALKGDRKPQSAPNFQLSRLVYNTNVPLVGSVHLRTGIYQEANTNEFKGCVLYLQGLADSIRNHNPLFSALSKAGYRIVTFDYMGQGGSEGTMNHTRVHDLVFPTLEIGEQAKFIWNNLSKDCHKSKKMVMGWSTGGLATYKLAMEGWADSVILIAPGIYPKIYVGEAATKPSLMFTFDQVITEKTLTRNKFETENNPHLDPIKPVSPTHVPMFATNLLVTSVESHLWNISAKVNGLVFLSGKEDSYVDRDLTIMALNGNNTQKGKASHFTVISYDGALHEIDNEVPEVAEDMYAKTIEYFDSHLKK